jgi:hypothetical protein
MVREVQCGLKGLDEYTCLLWALTHPVHQSFGSLPLLDDLPDTRTHCRVLRFIMKSSSSSIKFNRSYLIHDKMLRSRVFLMRVAFLALAFLFFRTVRTLGLCACRCDCAHDAFRPYSLSHVSNSSYGAR